MNKTAKQKLCWNCEGSVAHHLEHCPYCGVYLSPVAIDEKEISNSLLKAPYPLIPPKADQKVPQAPYPATDSEESQPSAGAEDEPSLKYLQTDNPAIALALMVFGTTFFLFGLILFLYSDKTTFTLTWSTSYWYFYFFLGLPILVCGYFTYQKISEK